jgi:hypothetical protein
MLKTIHVHTDLKFVSGTSRFSGPEFDNTIILIGVSTPYYAGVYSGQAIFVSKSRHDLNKVVEICSTADLVVLYGLDIIKSYITTKLPRNVVVAWRFFGYELYGRKITNYLSEESIASYPVRLAETWDFLAQLKLRVEYGSFPDRLFVDAIKRIDLFLGLSRREYDYLLCQYANLPTFIQLPFLQSPLPPDIGGKKDDVILVGNSANIENNHIDIIDIIEHSGVSEDVSFLVPFSYGHGRRYSRNWFYSNAVRHRVTRSLNNFHLLEDFLPRETYYELIASVKGAVFNSYRQMALGNIFALLSSGVKVYLNTRNVIYHWFVDFGLEVYTIENLRADLESGCFELKTIDKTANTIAMERLRQEYNREKFTKDILEALGNRT